MTRAQVLAAAGMEILEQDGSTIVASVETTSGAVMVVADISRTGDLLLIDGVHVDGQGLTRSRIRQLALALGTFEDVSEVVVQGGRRTSGARPGSIPSAIRVRVER